MNTLLHLRYQHVQAYVCKCVCRHSMLQLCECVCSHKELISSTSAGPCKYTHTHIVVPFCACIRTCIHMLVQVTSTQTSAFGISKHLPFSGHPGGFRLPHDKLPIKLYSFSSVTAVMTRGHNLSAPSCTASMSIAGLCMLGSPGNVCCGDGESVSRLCDALAAKSPCRL